MGTIADGADSPIIIESGPGNPEQEPSAVIQFQSSKGFIDREATSVAVGVKGFSAKKVRILDGGDPWDVAKRCWQVSIEPAGIYIWSDDHGSTVRIRSKNILKWVPGNPPASGYYIALAKDPITSITLIVLGQPVQEVPVTSRVRVIIDYATQSI